MLSKEASSTIFWVFGMTRPGIKRRSPGLLANTLTILQPWRPQITSYIYLSSKSSSLQNTSLHCMHKSNLAHYFCLIQQFLIQPIPNLGHEENNICTYSSGLQSIFFWLSFLSANIYWWPPLHVYFLIHTCLSRYFILWWDITKRKGSLF